MKKILQVGDPILEKESIPVKDPRSSETQGLINDLTTICKHYEKIAGGLSAPQIGENLNICIVRRIDLEESFQKKKKKFPRSRLWEVLINPEIIKLGNKKDIYWEGCLSVEMGEVFGPIERPSFVKVKYLDRYGHDKVLIASGFFAHEILHEYDHLLGILFISYIKNPKNLWKDKEIDEYLQRHGDLPEIID